MNLYSADFGNSGTGPIEAVVQVRAETPEEALGYVKDYLRECVELARHLQFDTNVVYANVYFNVDALTLDDIVLDEEDIDE